MSQAVAIKNFAGLYKENGNVQDQYFFCEKIETRAINFGWKVDPHFHSQLYQIFLVRKGRAKIYLSAQQYTLEGSFLIFIPPNIIHGFDFDTDIDGEILSFSAYFVTTLINRFTQLSKHLNQPIMISTATNTAKEIKLLFETYYRLREIYHAAKTPLHEIFIHIKVADALMQTVAIQPEKKALSTTIQYSDLELFKTFQEIVKKEISPFKPLEEYAQQLNISLSHLNRICRNIEDASPLNIIQKEIINMAKILLMNEKVNISDIAYSLGFNDPSYFIRLFKKKVGTTPKIYRSHHLA